MSCAQGKTARRRSRLLIVLVSGIALALSGCGAGQITQTANQEAAVSGARGDAGPIAVRNAQLAFPADSDGVYPQGADAPLVVTIANTGSTDDALTSVSSPLAAKVTVQGSKALPARGSLAAEAPKAAGTSESSPGYAAPSQPAESSAAPGQGDQQHGGQSGATQSGAAESEVAAVLEQGKVRIVLGGLKARVVPGQTVPVTFTFRNAGKVSIDVPIGAATTEREGSGHSGGGHQGGH